MLGSEAWCRYTQERLRWVLPLATLFALACTNTEESAPEPFGNIQLQWAQGNTADFSNLRVALAWAHHALPAQLQITDDHAWPSTVDSLDFGLAQFPSDETLYDYGGRQGVLSVGGLFAYEDTDDDQKFTFTTLQDSSFRDRVVGWSPGLRVVSAPADVVETSQFAPGYSFHTTTYDVDGIESHALEELYGNDVVIAMDTFDAPEAQCFGLSPGLLKVPVSVDTRPSESSWQFGEWFEGYDGQPYITGIPECPFAFDDRPSGWDGYQATCIVGQESLIAFRVTESADETIAAMCGLQLSKCRVVLDEDRNPPRGLPAGVCDGP